MPRIFSPQYLGCPTCNSNSKKGHSAHKTTAHTKLGVDLYKGFGCGHEFTLFAGLRNGCHGTFGILRAFSCWQWTSNQVVVAGQLATISIPIPKNICLFAWFLTQFSKDDSPSIVVIPRTIDILQDGILISTSTLLNTPNEMLGAHIHLTVGVYGRQESESRGWTRLLFESLNDYAEKRFAISVFKLATSLDIAIDRCLEIYLEKKSIPPQLVHRLLRSGRSWPERISRFREIARAVLDPEEFTVFEASEKEFGNTVRKFRNAFAHDDPVSLDYSTASLAFEIAFPIFWAIECVLTDSQKK